MKPDDLIRQILSLPYEDDSEVVLGDGKVITDIWMRGDGAMVIEVIEKRFLNKGEDK
jgi:hypothetical protein